MEYNFREVEKKWQKYWKDNNTFKTYNPTDAGYSSSPSGRRGGAPYFVLDMFPYPSGAGLHVGHPLGYIASDIFARYKRLKGFNVLHPMGYDSFGLPAEQYAIQTGQHPRITTENNIARYREQLDKIGFSFDWDREVRTSDPQYYKWTQWIFIQLFNSWYNKNSNKAENIETLITEFEKTGNVNINAACEITDVFSSSDWNAFSEKDKSDVLLSYRLAFLSNTMVNWCPQLGTVLANEEVKEGVSERGGYPVERQLMKQWSLRITAYADRLLADLDALDWTESIKEAQRNWIGKSEGTSLKFKIQESSIKNQDLTDTSIEVFTTRPDTIFGVSFVTLAPEHELVGTLTTAEQKNAVDEYITFAKNRSERERMADVKKITGVFTGAYVIHPFTGKQVPIWIGDYVLAGYGTGAVMAVPGHDSRDYAFANHFGIDKLIIIQPPVDWDFDEKSFDEKEGTLINSDFLNGLEVKAAIKKIIEVIEERGLGKGKTNFRLRDAIFGRQRYWGEPIPVYYENGIPKVVSESELPLLLPEVDKYLPTETGEPPLARATNWKKPLSGSPQRGEGAKPKWQTASDSTWEELEKRSNELRNNPTETEKILWQQLKSKQLDDKFRRQHVIGNNIVDFVCLDKNFVLEVDGKIHDSKKNYDEARTKEIESIGFRVIRFTNDEIIGNIDSVIEIIKSALSEVLPLGEDLGGASYECSTMPGWAGSSWYFLRYMDAHNDKTFASKEAVDYWQNVDLYIGGAEHATGHLLYIRFWTKFLNDLGLIPVTEPAKKLINQGMIQGVSSFVYRAVRFQNDTEQSDEAKESFMDNKFPDVFISKGMFDALKSESNDEYNKAIKIINDFSTEFTKNIKKLYPAISGHMSISDRIEDYFRLNVDVNIVHNNVLDQEAFRNWREEYKNAIFITEENGDYICGSEVEKMSKSKWNVVSPDKIVEEQGADCLRLYEMFLGPLEQSKPWNTSGISGVSNFMRKLWSLYHTQSPSPLGEGWGVGSEPATKPELKTLHKTIKKIAYDIENFSFNTSVSNFMICVNELTEFKCNKREILEPLAILMSPYAPHIAEELWWKLGHTESITYATFPVCNEAYLIESSFNYPISFNGKTRFFQEYDRSLSKEEVEKEVLNLDQTQKYLEGKTPKKVIVVPNKIVNIVI